MKKKSDIIELVRVLVDVIHIIVTVSSHWF